MDLIFYLPIKVHLFISKKEFYLYIYSFAILSLDEKKKINRLKNKIDTTKFAKPEKEDIKIIQAIHLQKINILIPYSLANQKAYLFYPLLSMNHMDERIKVHIASNGHFYICIDVKIVNIIKEIILIRRTKKHAKSYQ